MEKTADFEQLNRFKYDLDKCTKCGFCMSSCPVYREEKTESAVARGKIMLVRSLLSGDLETTDEIARDAEPLHSMHDLRAELPGRYARAGTDNRRPGG